MHRWLPACLLAFASGCAALRTDSQSGSPGLSPEDVLLAEALGHYTKGLLYESEWGRQSPEAMREFDRAADLDPGRYRIHAHVAAGALMNRDTARAAGTLEALCRQNPTSVVARTDLATVYNWMGQPAKAVASYREALRLDPGRTQTYQELAVLLFGRNRDREALDVVTTGLRKSQQPIVLVAYLNAQAAEFLREGSADRATACFESLAIHSPTRQREFQNLLAEVYDAQGRRDEAAAAYERAVSIDPPLPISYVRLASLRMESDPEKAAETLRQGLNRLPDDPALLFALAYVYVRADRTVEALDILQRLRETSEGVDKPPLAPAVYLFYASACERAGKRDLAEKVMMECVRLHPDAHEALNYVAYTWAERGERLDDAYAYVKRALESEPDNAAYLDTLGWIYYRQRKYEDALRHIQRAAQLMGDDATILDHLGDTLLALGDVAGAIEHWKRSYAIHAGEGTVRQKLVDHGVAPDTIPPAVPKKPAEVTAEGDATPSPP